MTALSCLSPTYSPRLRTGVDPLRRGHGRRLSRRCAQGADRSRHQDRRAGRPRRRRHDGAGGGDRWRREALGSGRALGAPAARARVPVARRASIRRWSGSSAPPVFLLSPLLVLVVAACMYAASVLAVARQLHRPVGAARRRDTGTRSKWLFDPPILPTIVPRAVVLAVLVIAAVLWRLAAVRPRAGRAVAPALARRLLVAACRIAARRVGAHRPRWSTRCGRLVRGASERAAAGGGGDRPPLRGRADRQLRPAWIPRGDGRRARPRRPSRSRGRRAGRARSSGVRGAPARGQPRARPRSWISPDRSASWS